MFRTGPSTGAEAAAIKRFCPLIYLTRARNQAVRGALAGSVFIAAPIAILCLPQPAGHRVDRMRFLHRHVVQWLRAPARAAQRGLGAARLSSAGCARPGTRWPLSRNARQLRSLAPGCRTERAAHESEICRLLVISRTSLTISLAAVRRWPMRRLLIPQSPDGAALLVNQKR